MLAGKKSVGSKRTFIHAALVRIDSIAHILSSGQVNCKLGPASDKKAFADFISELREVFDEHGLLLSAAVSPNRKVIDAGNFIKPVIITRRKRGGEFVFS